MKRSLLFGLVLASVVWGTAARADSKAEAAERFDRALGLVNVGDLSGGLAEFKRAYGLVPSPVVAFNLGLVYAALHRPVDAVSSLEAAVKRPEALEAEDLARARMLLVEQRARIATVSLTTNVQQGVIEVDNVEWGKLPIRAPLPISAGSHVIGVISPGFAPARREVVVAGREAASVRLDLVAIEGLLAHVAVRCSIPAVDVLVDGERVGTTPLEKTVTVTPGAHRFEARRPGYVAATHALTLDGGAQANITLQPTLDTARLQSEGGYLAVRASQSQTLISVDGDEPRLLTEPMHLPRGPHRIHLERGGFLPANRDVLVPLGKSLDVKVVFEPTPETRAHHVEAAQSRRTWSIVTVAAGAVIGGGGVAFAIINNGKLPGAQGELAQLNSDFEWKSGRACDFSFPHEPDPNAAQADCEARLSNASSHVDNLKTARTVGWVAAGVGGAVLVAGTVLLLTGDDPHLYDHKPTHRLLSNLRVLPDLGARSLVLTTGAVF
jgi:hypothetical protein